MVRAQFSRQGPLLLLLLLPRESIDEVAQQLPQAVCAFDAFLVGGSLSGRGNLRLSCGRGASDDASFHTSHTFISAHTFQVFIVIAYPISCSAWLGRDPV